MDDPTEPRPQRNGTCLALTSSETDTGQTRPGKARQGEGHPQDTAAVGHQATPTHIKIEPPSPPQAHRRLTTHAHRSPQSARKHRAPQPLHHAAQHAPRRPWGAAPAAHAPTATLYATRAPWKAAVRRKSRVVRERHGVSRARRGSRTHARFDDGTLDTDIVHTLKAVPRHLAHDDEAHAASEVLLEVALGLCPSACSQARTPET